MKNSVSLGAQRVQEARSKNTKLKEYGMKLMEEKKSLEFQIQQKNAVTASSSGFHDVAFKPVKSPPVTKKNLNYHRPPRSSAPGGQTNDFNGFNLDSTQTFQGGQNFFNKSAFETPMHLKNVRKFNF